MSLNPIAQINVITIAGIVIIFILTYFTLRKLFFDPYINVMEARNSKIEDSFSKQEEAKKIKEEAQKEAGRIISEAKAKADEMSNEAREKAETLREEKHTEAKAKADEILAKGREEVKVLRKAEEEKLKQNLSGCVNQALCKLIGDVDEKMVEITVHKVLATQEGTE